MVQSEPDSEDERPQGNGDPGEPRPDETPAGVPQPLDPGDSIEELIRREASTGAAAPTGGPPSGAAVEQPDSRQRAAFPSGVDPEQAADLKTLASSAASSAFLGLSFLKRVGLELIAFLKMFASAAVYATLIVTFGFQVARVEGKSMEPTLQDQDRLIVNKAMYIFNSWPRVSWLMGARDPQPGDIVMLQYPKDPDKSFVKRIIAEPGDTVRIEDGQVYVNEVALTDEFVPPEYRSHENHGPEIVQEAYYYVMGDHRNNSSDSRHWGPVPKGYIIGKVQLRWWPLNEARLF